MSPGGTASPFALTEDLSTYRALYQVAHVVATPGAPKDALKEILGILIAFFDASAGSIALLSPDTGRLEIEVYQGLPADSTDLALRLGQGITGWVAFHGRPQLIPDVRKDNRYISVKPEVQCEMAVPLETNGHVLGVISIDATEVAKFNDTHLRLLIRLSSEAAVVMGRLWQLKNLHGKAQQLESLMAIGQSLVTKLDTDGLYDAVIRNARSILIGRCALLYHYDASNGTLRLVAGDGPNLPTVPGDPLPLNSCVLASVVHTRRRVEFSDVQAPEFYDVIDLPPDPHCRSMIAVPISYEKTLWGALVVFTDHVHRFNNDEKRLVGALASLAAVALQNIELYARVFQSEDSLRKNEQLTTLGLLAAEIAHEIRNPLTVIKLLYGYLDLDFPEDDPRRTDVRVIGEKLDQLEAIVSRVLNFAKAPTSLHSRWPLHDIIDDTVVLIRLKLAQSKIELTVVPAARPLFVDVHKGQIQQVLLNLLINATQAMAEGGRIIIRVSLLESTESACVGCVDIEDTGTGIPLEFRDNIFDSFLSGRPDGTGLGLAIAKRILVSHHGDLTLHATSPAGTTMRLTLPLCRA